MSTELKLPDNPASTTLAIARELARRFPPNVLADRIDELLNARMPAKKGEKVGRVNERAVESAIKLIALLHQMAANERKTLGPAPNTPESDHETLARLAASPAAKKQAAALLASSEEGQQIMREAMEKAPVVLEMGVDETTPSKSEKPKPGSDREIQGGR